MTSNIKILLFFLISSEFLLAQETNLIVTDSVSGKSMLIGLTTREAFSDSNFSWWYNSEYELYSPDTLLISGFAESMKSTAITIIMGTWCSDSRREVPRFLKILDLAKYPPDSLTIISVDRDKMAGTIKMEDYETELVPTFIFYSKGGEIGRITEIPQGTLEEDTAAILSK